MAIAPDMYITGRYADGKAKARHEKIVMADHGCSCIRLTLIRRADQVDMWEAFQYSFPTKLLTKYIMRNPDLEQRPTDQRFSFSSVGTLGMRFLFWSLPSLSDKDVLGGSHRCRSCGSSEVWGIENLAGIQEHIACSCIGNHVSMYREKSPLGRVPRTRHRLWNTR
jgi:hypothetical protein